MELVEVDETGDAVGIFRCPVCKRDVDAYVTPE
jgi:hypothetical protein